MSTNVSSTVWGVVSGVAADVDITYNQHINPPTNNVKSGFANLASCNDDGVVTGVRSVYECYSSDDWRLATGMSTPLFDYNFTGIAQATGVWKCVFNTMTMSEGLGFVTCNANSIATTGTGCALSTWPYFKLQSGAELYAVANVSIVSASIQPGQIMELGLFLPTATTAPADGAYFRITSPTGSIGVLNYNGVETTSIFLSGSALTSGSLHLLGINVNTQFTEFWIDNNLAGVVNTPVTQGVPFSSVALPYTFQQRSVGSSGTQAQLLVSSVHVEQDDLQLGMPGSHLLSAAGQCAYQGQEGNTPGSTAAILNAAGGSPTMPTYGGLSNTVALVSGSLGGVASINPNVLALNDDGIVFDYQNSTGTTNVLGRKLIITNVQVQGVVTSLITQTAATSFLWQLAYGHTSVSQATTESTTFSSPTTKAPRKIAIGTDTYPGTSTVAVGVVGSTRPLKLDLTQGPIVVNPGEHISIIARNITNVPASTGTPTITVFATFVGYWV
jgi:hypothetical protein